MAVNAPTLTSIVDAEDVAGDEVTITLTPPALGDYDHTQVLYRLVGATAWTTGPTYTGAQGVAGTKAVDSLAVRTMHEFILYAVDASGNAGPPSIAARCMPTTGEGPISLRIEDFLLAQVATMTTLNGFYTDIEDYWVFRYPKDVEDLSGLYVILFLPTMEYNQGPLKGSDRISDSYLNVTVIACHDGRTAGDSDWIRERAHKMAASVAIAILEDRTCGNLSIDITRSDVTLTPSEETRFSDAVAYSAFRVHYRTHDDNPYQLGRD